jgi:predicted kinase
MGAGTAHLLYGYLGAGKTTFGKQLERELPAVRFSHDEWMTALHGADPPAEQFREAYDRLYALMETQWTRVLACGVDVVLDYGLWTRSSRDAVRERVRTLNGRTRLYWLRCAEPVALARCRARNLNPQGSLYIADATFEALKGRFEPLDADEEHAFIDTTDQVA